MTSVSDTSLADHDTTSRKRQREDDDHARVTQPQHDQLDNEKQTEKDGNGKGQVKEERDGEEDGVNSSEVDEVDEVDGTEEEKTTPSLLSTIPIFKTEDDPTSASTPQSTTPSSPSKSLPIAPPRRTRRKITDISATDLWVCPLYLCNKKYKKTSIQSIAQHRDKCAARPLVRQWEAEQEMARQKERQLQGAMQRLAEQQRDLQRQKEEQQAHHAAIVQQAAQAAIQQMHHTATIHQHQHYHQPVYRPPEWQTTHITGQSPAPVPPSSYYPPGVPPPPPPAPPASLLYQSSPSTSAEPSNPTFNSAANTGVPPQPHSVAALQSSGGWPAYYPSNPLSFGGGAPSVSGAGPPPPPSGGHFVAPPGFPPPHLRPPTLSPSQPAMNSAMNGVVGAGAPAHPSQFNNPTHLYHQPPHPPPAPPRPLGGVTVTSPPHLGQFASPPPLTHIATQTTAAFMYPPHPPSYSPYHPSLHPSSPHVPPSHLSTALHSRVPFPVDSKSLHQVHVASSPPGPSVVH